MRFVAVIPARYGSHRLPGKPLLEIAGKPLVEWVFRRVSECACLEQVIVATDDERIAGVVEGFGGQAMMTDPEHVSGTDRVAEVARSVEADVFVNVQGDEPLIAAELIEELCRCLVEDDQLEVATARFRISEPEEMESPHAVKVVTDRRGKALYFSRSRIPYPKGEGACYKHLGLYAYRRRFLLRLARLEPSQLELAEGLEQLRFLENGVPVRVIEAAQDSIGVDTQADCDRVRPLLENTLQVGGETGK